MKINKKILENIIRQEVQAVMTPGGMGGGTSNRTMRIIKKALERIGEVVNPLMNVAELATQIQYDDFEEMVSDGGREPATQDMDDEGGMEISSDLLKQQIMMYLKENKQTTSLIYMTIYDMEPEVLKTYIQQIAGNA